MEYSSAEMTCVLKLKSQCETCKVKLMQILKNVTGVYSITIDGEQGTVKITGRVNPSSLLGVLDKYRRHGELKYIKFDGEIIPQNNRRPSCFCYFGEHDNQYCSPYGLINTNNNYNTYPLFPQPHHYLYHEPNYLGFVPPLVPPPLPPSAMPLRATPPFPPPLAPLWVPAQPRPPPPPLEKAHRHCTIM